MDTDFCDSALEEALDRFGAPEIFNTDQRAKFCNQECTQALKNAGVPLPWTAKRWTDNVFSAHLWHSEKRECLSLR